ncbi:hypothetical protein [Paracraurococcus ruber]|uniref:Uncharacterized protein n=1 Tax=Paracraurococcus ruber TaxID=77675 RepID=A0ABS1CX59_9PROT|nr:hypothetical protein [Paracraurococcus ruber]MBK1658891.1 hypothetical protein [Paracraurococcus ruber]TDG32256.1 hypothetical protein E2C05_07895 [Paracraurococcus ruber]
MVPATAACLRLGDRFRFQDPTKASPFLAEFTDLLTDVRAALTSQTNVVETVLKRTPRPSAAPSGRMATSPATASVMA